MGDLFKLKQAILNNTCRPTAQELSQSNSGKPLRTSRFFEDDADVGVILFVGLATELGNDIKEIEMQISLDALEIEYKKGLYQKCLTGKRFLNKIRLVKNYMRLC